jgi:hypothetical protein
LNAQLSIFGHLLAFADAQASNNPKLRYLDWATAYENIPVKNVQNKTYMVDPGATLTIFSGARTLLVDGTTAFDLTINPAFDGVYRMTKSAGTAPGFRTNRALTLSGNQITATVNNNVTMLFGLEASSTQNFSAVQVGDTVFIPGVTTGDSAGPFNQLNEGFWVVLAVVTVASVANHGLVVQRPAGQAFQGVSEVVLAGSVTANSQFQAFSAGPVQPGDTLELSAGFSIVTQQSYQISTVTPTWVEFLSSSPIPLETGIIPTAAGIKIYTAAQNYVRVEADQLAYVKINQGSNIPLRTRQVGEIGGRGFFELWGDIWQLDVINRNTGSQMNTFVVSAEEDRG